MVTLSFFNNVLKSSKFWLIKSSLVGVTFKLSIKIKNKSRGQKQHNLRSLISANVVYAICCIMFSG